MLPSTAAEAVAAGAGGPSADVGSSFFTSADESVFTSLLVSPDGMPKERIHANKLINSQYMMITELLNACPPLLAAHET